MDKEWEWRTVRVYVDIRVQGPVRDKDMVWSVQAALDDGRRHMTHRLPHMCRFGKVIAKSKSHVDAAEERAERALGDAPF